MRNIRVENQGIFIQNGYFEGEIMGELKYKVKMNEKEIVIKIQKPEGTPKQFKDLERLKSLPLGKFILWLSWMPIHPEWEESAYWEMMQGGLEDLAPPWGRSDPKYQRLLRIMKKVILRYNVDLETCEKKIHNIQVEGYDISRLITLKEENEKLRNKLSAYESHYKDKRKKSK